MAIRDKGKSYDNFVLHIFQVSSGDLLGYAPCAIVYFKVLWSSPALTPAI
jgi:hypothetical protein